MKKKRFKEKKELLKKIGELLEENYPSGIYLFMSTKIQISKVGKNQNEKIKHFYAKRREKGLCVNCGVKITKTNKKTGKLYITCDKHRRIYNNRVAK